MNRQKMLLAGQAAAERASEMNEAMQEAIREECAAAAHKMSSRAADLGLDWSAAHEHSAKKYDCTLLEHLADLLAEVASEAFHFPRPEDADSDAMTDYCERSD